MMRITSRLVFATGLTMMSFYGICDEAACAVPSGMRLLVASFGTIDSQAEVEGWLSDQLRPLKGIDSSPKLDAGEQTLNPQLAVEVAYVNWKDRCIRYYKTNEALAAENARRARILTNLKTHMLSDSAQRYTQLGRDYLQAKLYGKCGKLISVVDRGNMTIQQTEKQLRGRSADEISSADCVLSVVFGDRETSSRTIPVDNAGTEIKRTTYRQPFVGKVRDLSGNVLLAFDDVAECRLAQDNVVATTHGDPARRLVELACDKIADKIAAYFTVELKFRIKVPDGLDADDVEIAVDGKEIDGCAIRVLAYDHSIRASLEGCSSIERTVSCDSASAARIVKLNFKKKD